MNGMGVRRRPPGPGEQRLVRLRTHGKALAGPVVVLLVLAAACGVTVATMPAELEPWGWYGLAALTGLAALAWVVVPFLRWRSTTYTVTTHRLVTRSGILARRGHDVPLDRVVDVRYERSLSDRLLGCGTLLLQTASEATPVVLPDVPDVRQVHQLVSELVFGVQDAPQGAVVEEERR
ncbi:PH domain-containing protein [Auraticoccus sp. F435]|uniref:PH domain-containing protein n=1 Tax=Auraticoccus cholistanensis TaxID=2656650 RepID=A0A6A9UYA4_9ACTN|nr:PH domain-containing protein [Auraticoccus cholistanensis]